jgi:hypothetical protein
MIDVLLACVRKGTFGARTALFNHRESITGQPLDGNTGQPTALADH